MNFPIVDAHVHFWDPKQLSYPWLDDTPLLNRPFLVSDYHQAADPLGIEQIVFVQAEADAALFLQETAWVDELARLDPRITGIVAWAPLERGEAAREAIERLIQYSRVKGIRRIIQFEADIDFCLQPRFIQGVQMLAEYDLSFDICISHIHLANTLKFVRQCPNVRFMLDHIGKPDIKDALFQPWAAQLKELAQMPNVWCKISGLVTEADIAHWTPADLEPYLRHVFDCFGLDRLVFGSDWPVVTQAAAYQQWIDALLTFTADISEDDRRRLFHDNAVTFYRLSLD